MIKISDFGFWPGLGLPRPKLSYQKINPSQNIYAEKRVKVRSTPATTLQKRPVKITMYLGLDIIIKLKFTTIFERCAILNILNYLIFFTFYSVMSGIMVKLIDQL